jgi:hypothetical protein
MIPIIQSDTILATKLDSLILQNHRNFKELSNAIISNSNDKLFGFFSYDTIITVIITLGIFILSEYIRNSSIRKRTIKQQEQLRKSFKLNLNKLIPYIDTLEKAFITTFKNTTVDTGLYTIPILTYKYEFKSLLNIDIRELHNSFIEKNEIQDICSQIDSILYIIITSESYHEKIVDSSTKIFEEININYDEFLNLINEYLDEFRLKHGNELIEVKDFQIINELLFSYYSDYVSSRQISIFRTKLLEPVVNYILQNNLFRESDKANKIIKSAKNFINLYFDLELKMAAYRNQFVTFSNEIKELKNKIIENMGKINWE